MLPGLNPRPVAPGFGIRASKLYVDTATADPQTVVLPAGVLAGELLFMAVGPQTAGTLFDVSGWTQLFNGTTGSRRLAGYYRVASGGETTASVDYSGTGTTRTVRAVVYRIGGYGGTPECSSIVSGTSAAPDPPSLTPSWGDSKPTLWLPIMWGPVGGITTTANPSGYSFISDDTSSVLRVGSKLAKTASDDPGAFSLSASGDWCAVTCAVKAA